MWKPGQEPDTQTIQFSCSSCVLCILLFFSLLSVPCFALPAGALPYPCPSLGDGGLIQERLVIWVKFQGKTVLDVWSKIFTFQAVDTLPEWSKGVDSSSTSANCVGSNPTGVIWLHSSSPTPTKKTKCGCSRHALAHRSS